MQHMTKEQRYNFMKKTPVIWFGALICCALWGSAFPFIKLGYAASGIAPLDSATQILYAGIRFTIAGILVLLLGSILQRRILLSKVEEFGKIVWLSLFQTILQYLFFYMGLAHTTGIKASIITGTGVFLALLVSGFLYKMETVTKSKIIGCLIGFTGVIIINLSGSGIETGFSIRGEGFVFFAALAYAFSSVYMKKFSKAHNPVMLSGCQFLFGGLVLAMLGFVTGGRITCFSMVSLEILLWLSLVSAVAYTLWGILLKYNPVSKVAVFGFMNPVFGVILSTLLLNEQSSLGIQAVVALLFVCTGIYIVNR